MSLKKELLDELTEKQLKQLAISKGIQFSMTTAQEEYYSEWSEKDKIVDMISDKENITVGEIEAYLKQQRK